MAETSLRTFWTFLALFVLPIGALPQKDSVTFVGFVNDHHNKFSALLEVEVLTSSLPQDANLWLASDDPKACIGKAVYGRAQVEPVQNGLFRVGLHRKQTRQVWKKIRLIIEYLGDF